MDLVLLSEYIKEINVELHSIYFFLIKTNEALNFPVGCDVDGGAINPSHV